MKVAGPVFGALLGLAALSSAAFPALAADPAGLATPRLPLPEGEPQPAVAPASMAEIVASLESLARSEMTRQKVPGLAFAVVAGDRVVHAKGYGVRKEGTTLPVTEHTLFEGASLTKSFTSALVGMAVDEGRLRWDDRVVEILPGFRMYDPWVTREMRVDDLMAQRSGMPLWSLDEMGLFGWNRWDLANAVAFVEPVYSFRAQYSYVNTLWTWAAGLVERRWGLSWENALSRRILGPLGMTESTVDPEVLPYLDDVATGHIKLPDGTLWPAPPDWAYRDALDVAGPSGALRTTALDLTKWARLHLAEGSFEGTRLLSAETTSRLHAGRSLISATANRTTSYAQGWVYDSRPAGPVVWHSGNSLTMHGLVALYPSVNVALVVLTNEESNSLPEYMDWRLTSLLFGTPDPTAGAAASSPAFPPPLAPASARASRAAGPSAARTPLLPDAVVPPLPLSRYAGSYANPAFETVSVREKGGSLVVTVGPRKVELPAVHFSGNVFTLSLPGYPGWETTATFVVPPGAPATRLQVEKFSCVKEGWFERTGP